MPGARTGRGALRVWPVGLILAGCANGVDTSAAPSGDAGSVVQEAGASTDGLAPESSTDAAIQHDSDGGGADGNAAEAAGPEGASAETGAPPHDASTGDASVDASPSLPSPLGFWSFDEGAGTSSADLSGHGHAAQLVGGASWTAAGKQGAGLALDGTSGYADVGVPLVDTSASFTVLAWVKFAAAGSWQVVLSEDDVTGSLFGLKLRGDGSNQFDFDVERTDTASPGFVVAQSTSTVQSSVWVHLAGVHDASASGALKVYVNGALQANAAVGQALLPATGHFLIGRGLYNGAAGSFVNGAIDEVAAYDVALVDAQVGAIYAAQR